MAARRVLLTAVVAVSFACGSSGDPPAPPRPHATAALVPIARDGSGAPRKLLAVGRGPAVAGSSAAEQARAQLARHAASLGTSRAEIAALEVTRVTDTGRGGVVTAFRARVAGLAVVGSDIRVLTRRDGGLAVIAGRAPPPARERPRFLLSGAEAFARALAAELGRPISAADLVAGPDAAGAATFRAVGVPLLDPCRLERVMTPVAGALRAAYQIEILRQDDSGRARGAGYLIDAGSGAVLRRQRLDADASFQYRVWADPADARPHDGPLAGVTPHPTGTPDGFEPDATEPSLVTMEAFNGPQDPWLAAGATETTGNNVDAYADLGGDDGFNPGDIRPSITAPGVFDRAYDLDLDAQASTDQTMAAVTHLFYTTNWLHDWWYDSGFDEAAGNAQLDNLGRGGLDGDPLRAEAQDFSGANNANMMTPADGVSPRMQMFLFDGQAEQTELVIGPGEVAIEHRVADFGPDTYQVTDSIALATPADGCAAISGVSGSIALIDVGGCTPESKVRRAQAAGAVGAMITSILSDEVPPAMPDSAAVDPTIPAMAIRFADGQDIRSSIGAGGSPTAFMRREAGAGRRDAALDTAIVAHEWGHYLHHRLQSCGTYMCYAESEGWGDFVALHTMIRQGDDPQGTYAVGNYAVRDFVRLFGGDASYFGIRRAPYSRDLSKNAMSFRHITAFEPLPDTHPIFFINDDNTEPHNAGEIWALLLYEAYQQLLDRARDGDYSFDEARRRMSDYAVAGLSLAPADSTFLEMRDAILAAASLADPVDARALATGFARRGAGSCAVSPPFDSSDFTGLTEDFDIAPRLAIGAVTLDDSVASCDEDGWLDGLERGRVRVVVGNPGPEPLSGAQVTVSSSSPGLSFPQGTSVAVPTIAAFGAAEVSIEAALAATDGMAEVSISVDSSAAASCEVAAGAALSTPVNLDEKTDASRLDDVEAVSTPWAKTGSGAADIWSRPLDEGGSNHLWRGTDPGSPSDTQLVSPAVTAMATGSLVLSFQHRYDFEYSDGVYWDGGVIELTTDGGASWHDLSELVDIQYDGVLTDISGNPLGNRPAFAWQSADYPTMLPVSFDLGSSFAGQTVQFRFRIGADASVGATGWDIDNIELAGIEETPFPRLEPEDGCAAAPPDAGPDEPGEPDAGDGGEPDGGDAANGEDDDGGCGCRAASSSPSSSLALLLMALIAVRRRRM